MIRFRTTAEPSFFVTVKPTRGPQWSWGAGLRRCVCTTTPTQEKDNPRARRRKSERAFSFCILSGKFFASLGSAAGNDAAAANGGHSGPKAVATLANDAGRLVRALHGGILYLVFQLSSSIPSMKARKSRGPYTRKKNKKASAKKERRD